MKAVIAVVTLLALPTTAHAARFKDWMPGSQQAPFAAPWAHHGGPEACIVTGYGRSLRLLECGLLDPTERAIRNFTNQRTRR